MILRFTSVALVLLAQVPAVQAQVETQYQNREEREIYGNGAQGSESGSILDATNPMDLINRLRQSGMMDDATPPSDAVDAALKAFEASPGSVQAP